MNGHKNPPVGDQIEAWQERAAIIEEGCAVDRDKAERLAAIYFGLDYEDVIEFVQGSRSSAGGSDARAD